MTWNITNKCNIIRSYVCVLHLAKNLKHSAHKCQYGRCCILQQTIKMDILFHKFHCLHQQDLRTHYHKHKDVRLEHILSQVK